VSKENEGDKRMVELRGPPENLEKAEKHIWDVLDARTNQSASQADGF